MNFREREKFRSLYLATLAEELSCLENEELDSRMSEVAWTLLEQSNDLTGEQFLQLARSLEKAYREAMDQMTST
jgi:hypothetical protein